MDRSVAAAYSPFPEHGSCKFVDGREIVDRRRGLADSRQSASCLRKASSNPEVNPIVRRRPLARNWSLGLEGAMRNRPGTQCRFLPLVAEAVESRGFEKGRVHL
jgi:hypothetical protein